ncbi:hypothetical protein ACFXO2_41210 [Streptomyces sp. NPDC059152]|uniref:hypothetical protein n=1 Tax=Streptomyces sp. NPDC059152 TaxID=3346742 RepID=UPI0036C9B165
MTAVFLIAGLGALLLLAATYPDDAVRAVAGVALLAPLVAALALLVAGGTHV